jgi:glutaredoxin
MMQITLYTSDCSICIEAQKILGQSGAVYEKIDIREAEGLADFHFTVSQWDGNEKMPAMLVEDEFIVSKLLQGADVLLWLQDYMAKKEAIGLCHDKFWRGHKCCEKLQNIEE